MPTCIYCEQAIEPTDTYVEVLRGTNLDPDPSKWEEPGGVHLRCLRPEPLGALPMPPTLADEDIP